MAYEVERWVFELERWGCIGFIVSLLLGNFTFLKTITVVSQYFVGLIFIITNIYLINDNLKGIASKISKDEQLRQKQKSMNKLITEQQVQKIKDGQLQQAQINVQRLIMNKKMWEEEKQTLTKQLTKEKKMWKDEKQMLTEQLTKERKMWKVEKQMLMEQLTKERKMWEDEKHKLTDELKEASARYEEYTILEEEFKKLIEERQELLVKDKESEEDKERLEEKCTILLKEKEQFLKVIEEFQAYQRYSVSEINYLMLTIDGQKNHIQQYKELVNLQRDLISNNHHNAYQNAETASHMDQYYY